MREVFTKGSREVERERGWVKGRGEEWLCEIERCG